MVEKRLTRADKAPCWSCGEPRYAHMPQPHAERIEGFLANGTARLVPVGKPGVWGICPMPGIECAGFSEEFRKEFSLKQKKHLHGVGGNKIGC